MESKRTFFIELIRTLVVACCLIGSTALQAAIVAEYRMDAPSWNATAGEILDSTGNGYNGVAAAASTAPALLCYGADLSASEEDDYLDLDYRVLDGLNDFTLSMWYRSSNNSRTLLLSGANAAEERELHWELRPQDDEYRPRIKNDRDGDISIPSVDDGRWHHLVWTRNGGNNCFYVDGNLEGCNNLTTGALDIDPTGFIVGQEHKNLGYDFENNRGIEGYVDELYVFDNALSALEVAQLRTRAINGLNWDGSARTCPIVPPSGNLVAEYRMDAPSWNGSAGEVLDSSGNDYHGVAQSATTTSALLCEGADLSATSTADYLDLDNRALNGLTDFTLSMWYQSSSNSRMLLLSAANASEDKEVFWEFRDGDQFRPEIKDDRDGNIDIPSIDDGNWHHLAWTRSGSINCFYVDGVLEDCNNLVTGALDVDPTGLIVGQEQDDVGYDFANDRGIEGLVDELYIFSDALPASQIAQIRTNNLNGLNWDGSARTCAQLAPRAAYYFDQPSWNGTAGEVLDSSTNAYHGTAIAATTSEGLVCQAADLTAAGTGDYLDLDYRAIDGIDDFSIGMWVKSSNTGNKALLSGARAGGLVQANELIFWFSSATRFYFYFGSNRAFVNTPNIWDNTWHHVMWVRDGTSNCLYIDGTSMGCRTLTSAPRNIDPGGFIVGQEQDAVGASFIASQSVRGELDEFVIFDEALSASEVSSIYANNLAGLSWDGAVRSCPATGVNGFFVIHDTAGIYCAPERIGVRAIDSSGAVVTSYAQSITLDTGTGRGSWTLDTGGGVLNDGVADDGIATYLFDPADNGEAWFNLSYQDGPPVLDVDAYATSDNTIRDDDSEGALTFAPTGFTVTANLLANPPAGPVSDPLGSVTAGADFDVYLTAYGTTDDDPICGVIEDYAGPKAISLWQDWVDPGSGPRVASVNSVAIGASEVGATTQNLIFVGGQVALSARYKDVGRLRLNVKDSAMRGATDAFVARPADIDFVRIEDASGVASPTHGSATGAGFVAAGEAFTVTVDVVDAQGDRTPNFGLESSAESLILAADILVLPASGRRGSGDDGVLINATSFVADPVLGRFVNRSVAFDESGIVQLRTRIADGDYMGTGDALGQLSTNVGRFYPFQYELVASNLASSCGAFAYMDAPQISIRADIYARSFVGGTTQNYDASLVGNSGVAGVSLAAEHLDNGIDLGGRFSIVAPAWQLGRYDLNVGNALFSRLASPDGAYENLQVGIKVADTLDSRTLLGVDMDADNSGLCTLGNLCNAQTLGFLDVVYGRLALLPVQGPENEALSAAIEAQYFDGSGFVAYNADQCSTYLGGDASLSNYRDNLSAGETNITGPLAPTTLVSGREDISAPLQLSAPGVGNEGAVEVQLAVPDWLRYNWNGSGDESPSADATFGRYRGHDRIILWQQDP